MRSHNDFAGNVVEGVRIAHKVQLRDELCDFRLQSYDGWACSCVLLADGIEKLCPGSAEKARRGIE